MRKFPSSFIALPVGSKPFRREIHQKRKNGAKQTKETKSLPRKLRYSWRTGNGWPEADERRIAFRHVGSCRNRRRIYLICWLSVSLLRCGGTACPWRESADRWGRVISLWNFCWAQNGSPLHLAGTHTHTHGYISAVKSNALDDDSVAELPLLTLATAKCIAKSILWSII